MFYCLQNDAQRLKLTQHQRSYYAILIHDPKMGLGLKIVKFLSPSGLTPPPRVNIPGPPWILRIRSCNHTCYPPPPTRQTVETTPPRKDDCVQLDCPWAGPGRPSANFAGPGPGPHHIYFHNQYLMDFQQFRVFF